MTLSQKVVACTVLAFVLMASAGCRQLRPQPWEDARTEVAASARDIADRAQHNDVRYFKGLIVDDEKVPAVIREVVRSGIATNYAEHLKVESDTDARLVYLQDSGVEFETPFTVLLSLHDGKTRIDQIILGEYHEQGTARLGRLFEASRPSEITTPPSVSVALAPGRIEAGTEQSALISFTNNSLENIKVVQPLSGQVMIIDTSGDGVWVWGPFQALDTTGYVELGPFESVCDVVNFTAPPPGSYVVYGRANGVLSSAMGLATVER